jgi:hypothetical protein
MWVAALAAVVVLGSGCGRAEPAVLPGNTQLVAAYAIRGGFLPVSFVVIEAPALLVYSDGRVIAGAQHVLDVGRDSVADLVGELRSDLSGLDASEVSPQSRLVMDAPSTVFVVLRGDGSLQRVSANALSAVDDYPRALMRADTRLRDLAKRVDAEGAPYTSDRVRLVLQSDALDPSQPIADWPAAIGVPAAGQLGLRTADLSGADAAVVAASLPGDGWRTGRWPRYRTSDGEVYGVAWRYLTPDEDAGR